MTILPIIDYIFLHVKKSYFVRKLTKKNVDLGTLSLILKHIY